MNLHHQPGAAADIDAGHGLGPTAAAAAKIVVIARIERIETDPDRLHASRLQGSGPFFIEQGAVAAEHRHQPEPAGMARNLIDVLAQQRLAAGKHHQSFFAERGDLIEDRGDLGRGKFVCATAPACAGIEIAVGAGEIAAPR